MAKGRKLTTSRSERFLGSNYGYSQSRGTVTDVSEFGESDVWPVVEEIVNEDDQPTNSEWTPRSTTESNGGVSIRIRRRRDSHEEGHVAAGGLSLALDGSGKTAASRIVHQYGGHDSMAGSPRRRQVASSAPVNVPDWTKKYRVDSVESLLDSDDGVDDHMDMIPPHEYLAREYGKSRNSVFEGVGRTLKGRDMSRVRDAVWSQTGFDG
ncbi:hypothetical protein LguiA_025375 [Lonicera macranthoides]